MPLTTYTAGEVLTAASLNDNFTFAANNPTAPAMAIFNETQSSATSGGNATSGSYAKRTLNTTVVNEITGCSLATSEVTLPAGTYYAVGYTPAYGVGQMQNRLFNVTDSAVIQYGTAAPSYVGANNIGLLYAHFTLAASKAVALQMRVEATTTNGLGLAGGFGNDNVFSVLIITKVA
jgi:hypothetical protein